MLKNEEDYTTNDFAGIYRETAELIGVENTIRIHNRFQGQQITFPKRLFNIKFVKRLLRQGGKDIKLQDIALKYDYTERRLRQIMNYKKDD